MKIGNGENCILLRSLRFRLRPFLLEIVEGWSINGISNEIVSKELVYLLDVLKTTYLFFKLFYHLASFLLYQVFNLVQVGSNEHPLKLASNQSSVTELINPQWNVNAKHAEVVTSNWPPNLVKSSGRGGFFSEDIIMFVRSSNFCTKALFIFFFHFADFEFYRSLIIQKLANLKFLKKL